MKILIPQEITQAGKDYLTQHGYDYVMGSSVEEEVVAREIRDCDGLLIRTSKITSTILEQANKLKVIGRHGVGVDNIDLDAATQRGIQVTNTPTANADSVAEHTVALLLAVAHHILPMHQFATQGQWEMRDKVSYQQVSGKTLGLLGLGRIGLAVAEKCALGLQMNVIAYSPTIKSKTVPSYITKATQEQVVAQADFLSLHLPATLQTKGSVNSAIFTAMKQTATLINTARGDLIQETHLYEALTTQQIAAAALDVLQEEPPSSKHPLLTLPNVLLSPHYAALSQESFDCMGLHAAQGIHEVLSGQKPTWPVNHIQSS